MTFSFNHYNYNVQELEKSMTFYAEALRMKKVRRQKEPNGSWTWLYIGEGE